MSAVSGAGGRDQYACLFTNHNIMIVLKFHSWITEQIIALSLHIFNVTFSSEFGIKILNSRKIVPSTGNNEDINVNIFFLNPGVPVIVC